MTDAASPLSATVVPFRRTSGFQPKDRCYDGRMKGLRGDLAKLGADREARGASSPDTVGAAVVVVEANIYRAPSGRLAAEVERFVNYAHLRISRANIDAAVTEHLQRFPSIEQFIPLKQRDAGQQLVLAMEERRRLKIKTMKAIDETDESRTDYVRERKLRRDREYQRKKRAGRGATRREYEANSAQRNKPWEVLGISRRTYYRRLSVVGGTGVSSLDNKEPGATYLCQPNKNIGEQSGTIGRPTADEYRASAQRKSK